MNNKKGFTLSEVLVTLALISVILLIVVPSIMLITRRINKRLFEGKKEVILAAAELYGKDNSSSFDQNSELQINVAMLLQTGYIEPDEKNSDKCPSGVNLDNSNGCIINPIDKANLNEIQIKIIKKNDTYNALWDESNSGQKITELIKLICDKLQKNKSKNLTTNENGEPCGCEYEINEITQKWDSDTLVLNPNTNFCYFKEEDPKNWLYYSGIDFRIMGIEKNGENYFVKLITDDNI